MKRKAFTLVELLVVVMIIGMLMGILIPAVFSALEQANRASCANNLSQIGRGCQTYASASQQKWPDAVNTDATVGKWNLVGVSRADYKAPPSLRDPALVPANATGYKIDSNTACLWTLVSSGMMTPEVFHCPSQGSHVPDKDVAKFTDVVDFASELYVSYSYQNQLGGYRLTSTAGRASQLAVAADANPQRRDFWSAAPNPLAITVKPTDDAKGRLFVGTEDFINKWNTELGATGIQNVWELNSPNHKFEGQNVLYLDGHVEWKTNPYCGPSYDNIWMPRAKPAASTPIDPTKLDASLRKYVETTAGYTGNSVVSGSDDSFLVP